MAYFVAKIMLFVVPTLLVVLIIIEGPIKDRDWYLVRYGLIPKIFMVALVLLMTYVIYSMSMASEVKVFVSVIVWIFYLLTLIVLLGAFRNKIWFDCEAIYCQEFYGKKKKIHAGSILRKVKNSNGFRIIDKDKNKIDCLYFMSGAVELERFVDDQLKGHS